MIQGGLSGSHSGTKMRDEFSFEAGQNRLMCECGGYGFFTIFKDGKWAEILPQETKVITMDKACKILSKKYGQKVEIK